MKIKKFWLWVIIFLLVCIISPAVQGYCNETQVVTVANTSLTSSDYNVSVTRTCTEEYDNFSFLIVAIIFMFITALVVVSLIISKKMWLKVVLSLALALCLTTLVRFSSWFLSITNPLEVNLISALDHFYAMGVRSFYFLLAGGCLFLVVVALNAMKNHKRKKKAKEWHDWGEDEY